MNQAEFLASTIQPIVAFIVLCSVAIHGLSIPFFSLGRRVHSVSSRTWSRHATGPDWTTLTRHVTRGEDVVINRDRDASTMENGRAGLTEEEKTIMESRRTSSEGKPQQEDGSEPKAEDMLKSDDVGKEQMPPDGTETTMEWREGSDKVVERRAGPGEEVGNQTGFLYSTCVPAADILMSRLMSRSCGMRMRTGILVRRRRRAHCERRICTFSISDTLTRALLPLRRPRARSRRARDAMCSPLLKNLMESAKIM